MPEREAGPGNGGQVLGVASDQRQDGGRYARYLLIVLLLPLLALLAIFPVARTGWFLRTSKRDFWHAMEYQFSARAEPCDVVIYGDSTALLGADPAVIEARTGWKTCNLAITYAGLATTGNLALDRYLSTHKAPRFLVVEVLAAHLRPPALDDESGIVDGFLLADRELPPLRAAKLFLLHPEDSFHFASQVWKMFLGFTPSTSPDFSERTYRRDVADLAAHRGMLTTFHAGGHPECADQFPPPRFSASYVAGYRQYAERGMQVIVWPTPVRQCDAHLDEYRLGAGFLGIPSPLVLGADSFVDAQHLSALGVQRNSIALADALLEQSAASGSSAGDRLARQR